MGTRCGLGLRLKTGWSLGLEYGLDEDWDIYFDRDKNWYGIWGFGGDHVDWKRNMDWTMGI